MCLMFNAYFQTSSPIHSLFNTSAFSTTSTDSLSNTSAKSITSYKYSNQSSRSSEDDDSYSYVIGEDNDRDIRDRAAMVSDFFISHLFPDEAFGFPINIMFAKNFEGIFLNDLCYIDPDNFINDDSTCVFLNRMISTITLLLRSTDQPFLQDVRPLRYFAVQGGAMKRKPGIMLIRLVDDCIIKEDGIFWHDAQGFIEQTREIEPPIQMTEKLISKTYLTFSAQPERDFIINLCITGEGFSVFVMDHAGSVETGTIPFAEDSMSFLRLLMGLAFLPDKCLGVDPTIIRRDVNPSSGIKFLDRYQPYAGEFSCPIIDVFCDPPCQLSTPNPIAITRDPAPVGFDENICSVSIGSTVYRVVTVMFKSPSFIGRSTRVYLVELPNGRRAVLKDSWITTDGLEEAKILEELTIPFGPNLLQSTILRNTNDLRGEVSDRATIYEPRQKCRFATDPTGVHISHFTSLWELMVALLDIVITIMYLETKNWVHRDISDTNVLLREPGPDSDAKQRIREEFRDQLGLSQIESMRKTFKCREGLLIDYGHAAELLSSQEGPGREGNEDESEVRTGTPPFIAVELLLFGVPHRVVHDLESVFYVLLFICTHLEGPNNTVGNPPLYEQTHPSPMRHWFAAPGLIVLGDVKSSHMFLFFEERILPHISPYFQPLVPYIRKLWSVLHPQNNSGCHSTATCRDIVEVFKSALLDKELIEHARQPDSILGKRARPADLHARN